MLVHFLETRRLSGDGFTMKRFERGHTYSSPDEISETAACSAISNGWARMTKDWVEVYGENKTGFLDCLEFIKEHPGISQVAKDEVLFAVADLIDKSRKRLRPVPTNPATESDKLAIEVAATLQAFGANVLAVIGGEAA
jgi:hypothetical protein